MDSSANQMERAGGGWYPPDHGHEDTPARRAEFAGDEPETLEEE